MFEDGIRLVAMIYLKKDFQNGDQVTRRRIKKCYLIYSINIVYTINRGN